MNVESYRRRVHRYEFGKRSILLIGGALTLSFVGGIANFTFADTVGAWLWPFLLLLFVVGPAVLAYTAYLYVVLRRSGRDTADIVHADLAGAKRAFETDDLGRTLVSLEDMGWTLRNHRSRRIPRAVRDELLAYVESLEAVADRHGLVASSFDEFYPSAVAALGDSTEGEPLADDAGVASGEDRPPAAGTTVYGSATDGVDGTSRRGGQREGTRNDAEDVAAVDEPTRRRIHRFVRAKRVSVRLLVGFVLLSVLFVVTTWTPVLYVLLLMVLFVPLILVYTGYLYVALRLAGVDTAGLVSVGLPDDASVSAGEVPGDRRGDTRRRYSDDRHRGSGVRGTIEGALSATIDLLDTGLSVVVSTFERLYRSLRSTVFYRRSGVEAVTGDARPAGEDQSASESEAPGGLDAAAGRPTEPKVGPEPDDQRDPSGASVEPVRMEGARSPSAVPEAVSTRTDPGASGMAPAGTGPGAAVAPTGAGAPRFVKRVPISGFWLVVGGAFVVGIPFAFTGRPDVGFGFIGTVLTAYSLKLQLGQ